MSQKITSKNLSYNSTLPPFLARLHGQAGASAGDGPDPMLAARRRHAGPRSGSAEAEDAPLVVDEEGIAVGGVRVGQDGVVVDEGEDKEAGEKEKGDGAGDAAAGEANNDKEKEGHAERVVGIGAGRKRKAGKVVGGSEDVDQDADQNQRATAPAKTKKAGSEAGSKGGKDGAKTTAQKSKKKAKKIKLSFGDDDG